ncbi:hypothetical protein HDU82_006054 [Entophlyctis luteolus]|nr:hypothetical protein HDU82_006054 [Entophlyctis luteolus]
MKVEKRKPDLDRMGIFTEASYISTKEPYQEKKNQGTLLGRVKGKQFQTTPSKNGHDTRDVYFDKQFIRLFEATGKPLPPRAVPSPPPRETKPNFLTKPPKRGSAYGYANVTIGKAYEHISEPYDGAEEAARRERRDGRKKMVGERAFVSSSARMDFFNAFAGLIGDKANAKPSSAPSKKSSSQIANPFKPSSCCGYTINKYPVFELPTGLKDKGAAGGDSRPPKKLMPIFRPSGVGKSYPIRSIIEANCPIAPPQWLQDMIVASSKG